MSDTCPDSLPETDNEDAGSDGSLPDGTVFWPKPGEEIDMGPPLEGIEIIPGEPPASLQEIEDIVRDDFDRRWGYGRYQGMATEEGPPRVLERRTPIDLAPLLRRWRGLDLDVQDAAGEDPIQGSPVKKEFDDERETKYKPNGQDELDEFGAQAFESSQNGPGVDKKEPGTMRDTAALYVETGDRPATHQRLPVYTSRSTQTPVHIGDTPTATTPSYLSNPSTRSGPQNAGRREQYPETDQRRMGARHPRDDTADRPFLPQDSMYEASLLHARPVPLGGLLYLFPSSGNYELPAMLSGSNEAWVGNIAYLTTHAPLGSFREAQSQQGFVGTGSYIQVFQETPQPSRAEQTPQQYDRPGESHPMVNTEMPRPRAPSSAHLRQRLIDEFLVNNHGPSGPAVQLPASPMPQTTSLALSGVQVVGSISPVVELTPSDDIEARRRFRDQVLGIFGRR